MIALSLTAILLTFLFSFFVESAKIEKKLDTARMAITARQHLQTRLQSVLSGLSQEKIGEAIYMDFPEKGNGSLFTLFDNGIDPDPLFSGSIACRIYLDEENNLSLAMWPPVKDEKNPPWRKEILLSSVKNFEFEFLGSKVRAQKNEKIKPINHELVWRTLWPKGELSTPSIIRLSVFEEKKTDPLQFAFLLPSSDHFVTYLERGAKL